MKQLLFLFSALIFKGDYLLLGKRQVPALPLYFRQRNVLIERGASCGT